MFFFILYILRINFYVIIFLIIKLLYYYTTKTCLSTFFFQVYGSLLFSILIYSFQFQYLIYIQVKPFVELAIFALKDDWKWRKTNFQKLIFQVRYGHMFIWFFLVPLSLCLLLVFYEAPWIYNSQHLIQAKVNGLEQQIEQAKLPERKVENVKTFLAGCPKSYIAALKQESVLGYEQFIADYLVVVQDTKVESLSHDREVNKTQHQSSSFEIFLADIKKRNWYFDSQYAQVQVRKFHESTMLFMVRAKQTSLTPFISESDVSSIRLKSLEDPYIYVKDSLVDRSGHLYMDEARKQLKEIMDQVWRIRNPELAKQYDWYKSIEKSIYLQQKNLQ